jgi:hypothetical protein
MRPEISQKTLYEIEPATFRLVAQYQQNVLVVLLYFTSKFYAPCEYRTIDYIHDTTMDKSFVFYMPTEVLEKWTYLEEHFKLLLF